MQTEKTANQRKLTAVRLAGILAIAYLAMIIPYEAILYPALLAGVLADPVFGGD